jgi:hypothetical protein
VSKERPRGWRARAALNGTGAAITAVTTIVFLATKFTSGAWVTVIAEIEHVLQVDLITPLLLGRLARHARAGIRRRPARTW